MIKRWIRSIREKLPLEYRNSSLIVLFIFYILLRIIEGVLSKIGELITEKLTPILPGLLWELWKTIFSVFSYSVSINIFQICLYVLFAVPVYKLIDKLLIKRVRRGVVFEDNFDFGNKGWRLNYWGSNNPDRTCRLEESNMIFEADDSDLESPKKENGACIDLTNRINQGSKYEISCWVKASKGTTMGFKLWVHDTKSQAEMKSSPDFYIPTTGYKEIKAQFIATKSNALRIHLHYKSGRGKIYVNRVTVVKVR